MSEMTPKMVLEHLLAARKITGSWLAAHAAQEPLPQGNVMVDLHSHCAACGHAFLRGELAHMNPTLDSSTFNDAYSMRGSANDPVCAGCMATWGKKYLLNYSKAVACDEGLFPMASNQDRRWFLLNPPEPPFVMVAGLAKQQHTYWRTPVAWSREVFPIRVGTHVGMIRRAALQRVADICPSVLSASATWDAQCKGEDASSPKKGRGRPATPGAVVAKHPFARLDRDLESSQHGILKLQVAKYLASGSAPREFHVLAELNEIEFWALAAIVNTPPNDVRTTRPDRIGLPLNNAAE